MPTNKNKNYVSGRNKEYKVLLEEAEKRTGKKYRSLGKYHKEPDLILIRSAGSHSPIDTILIDRRAKEIVLTQCKPNSMSEAQKFKLEWELKDLIDTFKVSFKVV